MQVLKLMRQVEGVQLAMGPGDKVTTLGSDYKNASGQNVPYKDLDPTKEDQVSNRSV
jgi:hypothetical protein